MRRLQPYPAPIATELSENENGFFAKSDSDIQRPDIPVRGYQAAQAHQWNIHGVGRMEVTLRGLQRVVQNDNAKSVCGEIQIQSEPSMLQAQTSRLKNKRRLKGLRRRNIARMNLLSGFYPALVLPPFEWFEDCCYCDAYHGRHDAQQAICGDAS